MIFFWGDSLSESLMVAVRGVIGFFTLLIFARVLGKQQISQLTFFDYVLGITIGSTASTLTTDLTSRAWPHWIGLLVWSFLCFILQYVSLKSKKASEYLDGKPSIVIMNGKILEQELKKYRYNLEDLLEQLRGKDIFDIDEVAYAILEKDGQLSVLKKTEYNTVTLKDLNLQGDIANIGVEIIYDGKVLLDNLNKIKKDEIWLNNQLNKNNIKGVDEVFCAIYNPNKGLSIDLYKDNL